MAAFEFPSSQIDLALQQKFVAIAGPHYVRRASVGDSVSGVQPTFVVEPGDEQELAQVLRASNEAGATVVPRGGGTKIDWGSPLERADVVLSTSRLNRIIDHPWADLTVSVEAGCTMQALQDALAQHGQRLAIDVLWPGRATVGGVLSTNESGALRLRFGALRDLIIGVTIALPDGTLASSGGRVVKNVAGYDLPKLVTGAFGTLGVITRAVFRLHPLPRNARTFSLNAGGIENAQRLLLAIQDSKLAHTALQVRAETEQQPMLDILFEGTSEGLHAQEESLKVLARAASVEEVSESAWNARRELWVSADAAATAIAKISILPADIAKCVALAEELNASRKLRWKAIFQATGIGWIRVDGDAESRREFLQELRNVMERDGGSLVIFHSPRSPQVIDTWGSTGDALPLMKAIKHQLDPKRTLNPGRFVGGI